MITVTSYYIVADVNIIKVREEPFWYIMRKENRP